MSVFGRALGLQPQAEFNADPANAATWSSYAGTSAISGELIDPDTALKLSTAWAGIHLIANSIGMLPMSVFEMQVRGRRQAREQVLWPLLHTQPNASMTAGEFKAMLTAHALLRGGGYAEIVPGATGPVSELRPVHPDRVEKIVLMDDYSLRFWVKPSSGIGPAEPWTQERMFYLRGLSLDAVTGVSFVRYGVESLGLARAAEAYAARVYRNDATPRGTLEHPGKLSETAARRLKADWSARHSGENQHTVAVLEEGMRFNTISMTPEDTQMLASREYQDADIARWLGVPLFLLQIMSKSTSWGSGLEQIWEVFIATGLGFWATRWEQAIGRDLIAEPERYYVKINLTALIRGDIEKRFNAYNTGILGGFLTRNEVREKEELNALAGLDEPLIPLNMRGAWTPPDDTPDEDEPPTPTENRGAAHYQALLVEAAGRVARKELKALTAAERRHGDDFEGFAAEVTGFFATHGEYVAQALAVAPAIGADYAAQRQAEALAVAPAVLAAEDDLIDRLCALVEV